MESIESRLVKANVVARRLGVTEARAYELAKLGLLPCVRLGRQVRFQPEAVERFIEGGGATLPGGWRNEAGEAK